MSGEERLESLEDPESRSRVGFPEIDPDVSPLLAVGGIKVVMSTGGILLK